MTITTPYAQNAASFGFGTKTTPAQDAASDFKADLEAASSGDNTPRRVTAAEMAKKAVDKFMEFAEKTTEEKMRAMILAQMGLTEEEVAALPPEERAKLEEKIKDMIKAKLKEEAEKKIERSTREAEQRAQASINIATLSGGPDKAARAAGDIKKANDVERREDEITV